MGCVASYWRLGSVAPRVGLGALTPMLPSCPNAGAKPRVRAMTVARTDAIFMDEPGQHRRCQSARGSGQLEKLGLAVRRSPRIEASASIWGQTAVTAWHEPCPKFTPWLQPPSLPDARVAPDLRNRAGRARRPRRPSGSDETPRSA